ncbi:hypothetical protein P5V15_007030 [Pogonomyrmex californicus]
MALLLPNAQRFLKIFSALNLDDSYVMSMSYLTRSSSPARRTQHFSSILLTLAVKSLLACAARHLLSSAIRCCSSAMHHTLLFQGQSAVRTAVKLSRLSASKTAVDSSNNSAIALPSMELRLHVYDQTTNIKFLIDSGSAVSLVPKCPIAKPLTQTIRRTFVRRK